MDHHVEVPQVVVALAIQAWVLELRVLHLSIWKLKMGAKDDDTTVAPFQPRSLHEAVTDRVRSSFVDLIPDDVWKEMVEREILNFTNVNRSGCGHGSAEGSPFARLVKTELEGIFRAKIKAELDKPDWMGTFCGAGQDPGDAVKEMMQQLIPAMLEAVFGNVVQQTVDQVRQQLGVTTPY